MRALFNLVCGLVFGTGLILSGLANPAKIQNFLDLAGHWDPSLAFVMLGAISVTSVGFMLARRRGKPVCEDAFQLPPTTVVTQQLVAGSAIFGIGWGLGGLCPGPALVSLTLGAPGILVFVPTMLIGIAAVTYAQRRRPAQDDA